MSRDEPLERPVPNWLLLTHQMPAKPAYPRVKVWRRLQTIGAVPIKNTVYALPISEQSQEDFEWLLREITEGGGEAIIWAASLVDGLSDGEVEEIFRRARDADYDTLAKDLRALQDTLGGTPTSEAWGEAASQTKRIRTRLDQIIAVDFFGANGREMVDGLLRGIEQRLAEWNREREGTSAPEKPMEIFPMQTGQTWVTRRSVHIDRIASAWLIRRFIDKEAKFKFVAANGYTPMPKELRFDMFEAEFTHEGDRCTFEVLVARHDLADPALVAIGEIVHDIDMKDAKFGRDEAAGIRTLIAGICSSNADDNERIGRGAVIFDELYQFFGKPAR